MSEAQTHTIVVDFDAGRSPAYSAGMECLGGRVTAVAFDGDRLEVADALQEAAQCAYNVLSLLSEEVDRLGCRAGNVREKLRVAIEKAGGQA